MLGRLESITYPDSSTKRFAYTADGELDLVTRADGSTVDLEYDPDSHRLEQIVASSAQPGGAVRYAYDALGRLTATWDDDVSLEFGWDSVGNQLEESMSLPGIAPGLGQKTILRTMDDGNRPAVLELPDGTPYLQRQYDSGGRLSELRLGDDPSGGARLWAAEYHGGRLARLERGNGLATELSYDGAGRPLDVVTGPTDGDGVVTGVLHRLGLSWTDASLRRTKQRDDLRRQVERFHYDGVGHLESGADHAAVATTDSDLAAFLPDIRPVTLQEDWHVNLVDELTRRDRILEGRLEAEPRTHNNLHQVTDVGAVHYDWDVNGNLSRREADIVTTYSHDWRDRLVGVQHGALRTDLVVDPLGRLVAKVVHTGAGDLSRVYLHDGDQVVGARDRRAVGRAHGPSGTVSSASSETVPRVGPRP